jgi:amino acid transporter
MRGDIFMMRTAKACTTVNNGAGGTEISGGRCLRRDLGRLESYATLIGGLIGSGIFVVIGQAGGLAGPSVPLAYVALFPVVMATAMAYMVFMSTPLGERPGGAYVHISRTFGRFFPGFIAVWLQLVAYSGALGVLSLSLGQYMLFFFPNFAPVYTAAAILLFFYLVNLVGVKIYGGFQTAMFLILIAAVLILVIPGLRTIKMDYYAPLFPHGIKGFIAALSSLFMSYAGFEGLAQTAGETKNARKTLPMIFFKGIGITVVIYFFMSFVAFGNMHYNDLARSASAMTDVAKNYLPGWGAAVVALGAIMAFTTSINATLMVPPRLLMVLGEDRLVPEFFSHIHPRFRTPDVGLTITTGIAIALIMTNTLGVILAITLQAIFILYILHSTALIFLPIVNPGLYKSALFRPAKPVLIIVGSFSVVCMLIFSYSMLLSSWKQILFWGLAGIIIYAIAILHGHRSGINFEKIMKYGMGD